MFAPLEFVVIAAIIWLIAKTISLIRAKNLKALLLLWIGPVSLCFWALLTVEVQEYISNRALIAGYHTELHFSFNSALHKEKYVPDYVGEGLEMYPAFFGPIASLILLAVFSPIGTRLKQIGSFVLLWLVIYAPLMLFWLFISNSFHSKPEYPLDSNLPPIGTRAAKYPY